jgi:hypothetical protein
MNLGAVYTIPGKNYSEARRKKKKNKNKRALPPPIVYPHLPATSFKRKPTDTVDKVEREMKKKREKRKRKGTIK